MTNLFAKWNHDAKRILLNTHSEVMPVLQVRPSDCSPGFKHYCLAGVDGPVDERWLIIFEGPDEAEIAISQELVSCLDKIRKRAAEAVKTSKPC